MSADNPKAAPSLADGFVKRLLVDARYNTYLYGRNASGIITDLANALEDRALRLEAALRAVEAVRAFPELASGRCGTGEYFAGYRDGVRAVRALLEGGR